MKRILSQYWQGFPRTLVYMLQSTEYRIGPYLAWYWRTRDFRAVAKRRQLDMTRAARLLLLALQLGIVFQLTLSAILVIAGLRTENVVLIVTGVVVFLLYPLVWAHLAAVPLVFGRIFIAGPKERRLIERSKKIFAEHPGTIIAVAGSYGKTSMKELLRTVLSEGKKVAATPANRNVTSSHAEFAVTLEGDEEILIIEYGEGKPGDVSRFAQITRPDMAIITGLAPAHLDEYKTLEAAGQDIFSLSEYVGNEQIYVNGESAAARAFIRPSHYQYSQTGVLDWKVTDANVGIEGTRFTMHRDGRSLQLKSGLLGRHQIGPLALAVALADVLGLAPAQIESGVAKTMPFEHRMQPYALGGAWIIDDSYNGNIDGVRAGLNLLQELSAKRKIYVTPGLVDQGQETENVHLEMGRMIAAANPDQVILMQNSVEPFIQRGLDEGGYTGEVSVETDPLEFYTHIDQFVAAGDLALLQNDWTDNYA
jgi:UDP-N-acetylmuramoyl-tripeptide--D-alanyl-D-alanine ligase